LVGALGIQLDETLPFLRGISEEKSLHRYAPDKWSIRQVLSHVNDSEQVFLFRAFWFARGFDSPLPSYDQDICAGRRVFLGQPYRGVPGNPAGGGGPFS